MQTLAKLNPFRNLDPRIASELHGQRRAIYIGLACVLCVALLDFLVLMCVNSSVSAIQHAAPTFAAEKQRLEDRKKDLAVKADKVAEALHLSQQDTERAFKAKVGLLDSTETSDDDAILAEAIHQPREAVQRILADTGNRPHGDLDSVHKLGLFSIAVVFIFGCKYWFTRGQTYYLTAAASRLSSDLRERMYAKLLRLPVSYFADKRTGAIQSVLTNDVNVYQNAVTAIRESIQGPTSIIVSFVFVIWKAPQLVGVIALFIPGMVYVINRNGKKVKESQALVQNDLSHLSASTVESLHGMRVVKAFAGEKESLDRYSGLVEKSYLSQLAAGRRLATLRPMVELMGATALATVLYLCGWLSYFAYLDLGNIAALLLALDRVNQGMRNLSSVTATYNQVQAASEHIYGELLDVPDQIQAAGARALENVQGLLEFENVSFAYPDGTEALSDVSFRIEPGTSLALVGPSGAGKSTIADLILRFYDPTDGRILLDGVDLRELELHWLRSQIGVVPQNTFLFAGSIADNVRMGKTDATEAEIREAATAAHADEFIEQMELGYDSNIGEGGGRISGGQRQRIAIARALVRKPTLLLLDEATSALDATSEKAVTEALDTIMRERTSLFIAHRLTTAARADRILVLSRGRLVEEGSHGELMAKDGQYAALFRIFSGGLLEEGFA